MRDPGMTFSKKTIENLLQASISLRREMDEVYALLPPTHCRRRTHCCSMLPEITLVEALMALDLIAGMNPSSQRRSIERIVEYFFVNPARITSCPFLNGQDCIIYSGRFFGCRAYGLWSQEYYNELTVTNLQGKAFLRRNWENLGVFLPEQVMDFAVPYCIHVKADDGSNVEDGILSEVSLRIENISGRLAPWHESFQRNYFSDISFLIASLIYGVKNAVQMKFEIVRKIVTENDPAKLDEALSLLPDFFHLSMGTSQ